MLEGARSRLKVKVSVGCRGSVLLGGGSALSRPKGAGVGEVTGPQTMDDVDDVDVDEGVAGPHAASNSKPIITPKKAKRVWRQVNISPSADGGAQE